MNSSFNILPTEIKQQIFALDCRQFDISDICTWERRLTYRALTLGAVCQGWREIAYNTSELWSTIIVMGDCTKAEHIFELYLRNSGQHPLTICLNTFSMGGKQQASAVKIFGDVMKSCHRIKYLDVCIMGEKLIPPLRDVAKSIMPMLQHLSMKFKATARTRSLWCWDPPKKEFGKYFGDYPLLNSLTVDNFPDQIRHFETREQITNVHLCRMTPQDCVNSMKLLPNLINLTCDSVGGWNRQGYLSIDIYDSVPQQDEDDTIDTHRSLELVEFDRTGHRVVCEILKHFACPSLKKLTVNASPLFSSEKSNMLPTCVNLLLCRSGCRLKRVRDGEMDISFVAKDPNDNSSESENSDIYYSDDEDEESSLNEW